MQENLRSLMALTSITYLGIVFQGCKHTEQAESNIQLSAQMNAKWWQNNIPVCWEDGGWETEKGWVKSAIEQTWTKHSNLSFSGWGPCQPGMTGIHIEIRDNGPHVKALGRHLDGMNSGMSLNFSFNNWDSRCRDDRQNCIASIAVHEFGHALGFAHEQNRVDAPIDCQKEQQGTDPDLFLTGYDLFSVMNYCNPNWNGNGTLSINDIEGLHKFYAPPVNFQQQQFPINQWVKITARHSGKCLNVDAPINGSGKRNGANVQQWDCSVFWRNDDNSLWKFIETGDGYYKIISKEADRCLNVNAPTNELGKGNGVNVQIWDCEVPWRNSDNSHWKVVPIEDGYFKIISKHSMRCLNIHAPFNGTGMQNGANAQQWDCDVFWRDSTNNHWRIGF